MWNGNDRSLMMKRWRRRQRWLKKGINWHLDLCINQGNGADGVVAIFFFSLLPFAISLPPWSFAAEIDRSEGRKNCSGGACWIDCGRSANSKRKGISGPIDWRTVNRLVNRAINNHLLSRWDQVDDHCPRPFGGEGIDSDHEGVVDDGDEESIKLILFRFARCPSETHELVIRRNFCTHSIVALNIWPGHTRWS